ncbi:hypothetical protein H8L32_27360, partial [Undibacterium sp. CY18W]
LTAAQATNITIQHSDTGSNAITQNIVNARLAVDTGTSDTVALGSVAAHTGTVTIGTAAGAGKVGGFINFDTTTVGANGGLNRIDVSGAAADGSGV